MSAQSEPTYMVVDGTLGDLVEEFSALIDKLSPATEGEQSFTEYAAQIINSNDESKLEQAFLAIAKKSSTLSEASEKEYEPSYNLVFHILSFSSNLVDILPIVLENITKMPSYASAPVTTLAVLSNLFNILPASSPLRYSVFSKMLSIAESTDNIQLLVPYLENLSQWTAEWRLSEEDKQDLHIKVAKLLTSIDEESSYKCLFEAVSTSQSSTFPLTTKLVQTAITANFVFDFNSLLVLPAVSDLKLTEQILYELLVIVSNGDLAAYKQFIETNADFLPENNMDGEAILKKVKLLTLASIASKATTPALKYTTIAESLEVPVDEVEVWVIDAIRAGLIEGRLSQISEILEIHRASAIGVFGVEQWKTVDAKLENWKTNLKDILDVVRNARENAKKEKVAHVKA
ncbi:hypothetical protein NADFUDRAFT_81358 [Nadsonia fulvescens var. elongata DSM 6958]|uniref:Eukaryotic translation initiation factor 3 subunit M n=1 Tax=Nadsonia fulvescens var. elongata DSM 6958 TaxID=857566 RepID=A0A1E3PSH5_9ASCO|nr:hypothetical protein NADFUDRAFT_81358 [Nadsonia fulvescens var. elongata DSM 6958]